MSKSYYFKARACAQGTLVTLNNPENGTEDRRNVDEDFGVYPGRWKRTSEGVTFYLISVVYSPSDLTAVESTLEDGRGPLRE